MYIPFRQGLVRLQVDNNSAPSFLQKVNGGQFIDLIVSPVPTIICFAHGSVDYLFEETRTVSHAWGPFTGSLQNYWLFWDIDMLTGVRTFGHTKKQPVYSNNPPPPAQDQHWFDLTKMTMFVWNGTRWDERIRCFAAKYDNGSVILSHGPGSQAGINNPVNAGFILFDDDEKAIKKWKRDNKGNFITTETPLLTHASRVSNVVLDGVTKYVKASCAIPQWSVVTLNSFGSVALASHMDQSRPAAGISKWHMNIGDAGIIHTSGYITNNNWNWSLPAATPLFVGLSGQVTSVVPQIGSIQRIGMIVDSDTIFVDIGMHIILDES
jgi:hypothetical protein